MPGFYLPTENEFDPSSDDFIPVVMSKERQYRHFDLPLADHLRNVAIDFSIETKPHRFWPLLGYTDVSRHYIREKDEYGNWLKDATGKIVRTTKEKKRPIRFASHADAAYLQAYAEQLSLLYEQTLANDGSSGSVLAYRKGGGTNIHHAKSLFDELAKRRDCTVIAMDISGFFDSLDHILLRDEIAGLLGATRLDGHHARVWRNITRYSWMETDDLDRLLGRSRKAHGRICSPRNFERHVQGRKNGLVRTHDLDFGIPQGTPISGLYANIYLRAFDREMRAVVERYNGSYRRYSDDIAFALPLGAKVNHVVAVAEKILADFGLAVSEGKTDFAEFRNGLLTSLKPIQYLGFIFDGQAIRIRESSLDAYRRKMRKGIHAKLVAAKAKGIPSFYTFQREVRSRYTHQGKRRNFLKYAYKASEVMRSNEIRLQVKPHMTWFDRAWEKEVEKIYGGLVKLDRT